MFPSSELIVAVVFIDDNYDPDQDSQIHVFIIGNSFGIILEVTGQYIGRVRDNQQQQPTFFHYLNIALSLCSSMTINNHITTLKPLYSSSKPSFIYVLDQDAKTCMGEVYYFIGIFIEVIGETDT